MNRCLLFCLGLVLLCAGWACGDKKLPPAPKTAYVGFPPPSSGCTQLGLEFMDSSSVWDPTEMNLSEVFLVPAGHIQKVGIYLSQAVSGTIRLGVYDSTVTGYPNNLLADGVVSETPGWTVLPVANVPIATSTVWIAFQPQYPTLVGRSDQVYNYRKLNVFGSFPNVFPGGISSSTDGHFVAFISVCP
jgi:hypothetical protein